MRKKQTAASMPPRFVPAPRREPPPVEIQPLPPIDVSSGFAGIPDESRDSVSAQDRAKGFLVRNIPIYLAVVAMALGVTILYSMVAIFGDFGMPWALDRLLVFVTFLSIILAYVHVRANAEDYDHSRAGVERHRISAMRDISIAQIQADRDIRVESMKMITRREDE